MSSPVPPSPDRALAAHVETADATLAGRGARAPTSALLRVSALDAHPPGELACYPVDPIHPLDLLLGFVAPVHWWALGVSSSGLQHPIGRDGRVVRSADSPRVRVTVLIDRSGRGAGLLRRGDELTALPGPPDGTVADACRRALRLGTAPPPPTTVGLWTLCWLDRMVAALAESGGAGGGGPGPRTWRDLTRLHPASSVATLRWSGLGLGPDADTLADAARALADAWPWARLQRGPDRGRRSRAPARRPRGRMDGRRHVGSMVAGGVPCARRPDRRRVQPAGTEPREGGATGRAGVDRRGSVRADAGGARVMRRSVSAGTPERGGDRGQCTAHHKQRHGSGDFGWRSSTGAAREGRHDLRWQPSWGTVDIAAWGAAGTNVWRLMLRKHCDSDKLLSPTA